jgi:hypothetical protein
LPIVSTFLRILNLGHAQVSSERFFLHALGKAFPS